MTKTRSKVFKRSFRGRAQGIVTKDPWGESQVYTLIVKIRIKNANLSAPTGALVFILVYYLFIPHSVESTYYYHFDICTGTTMWGRKQSHQRSVRQCSIVNLEDVSLRMISASTQRCRSHYCNHIQ